MAGQIIMQVNIVGAGVYIDSSKRRTEYFNECILMLTVYTIICFTPFVPEVETKFYIGYMAISLVVLHLVVNLLIIFRSTVLLIKLKCKLRARRKDSEK